MNTSRGTATSNDWQIGVWATDITPTDPVFLFGYPHVPRMSTGVHDPLLVTAWWIAFADSACLFLGCDLIWLSKSFCKSIRDQLADELGLPTKAILISSTHTHSGPVTTQMLSNCADPIVPAPDPAYLQIVENALLDAAKKARHHSRPAKFSVSQIESTGLGGNRHDPAGPAIKSWPVFYAAEPDADKPFGIMCVCPMHPTVLHADSTVISGDFPGLARQSLQDAYGSECHYLHHMGASGDQSPRHVTREKTLSEAKRLGDLMASRIVEGFVASQPLAPGPIRMESDTIDLPLRKLPSPDEAKQACEHARARLDRLHAEGADPATVRAAEVDWFGAEETQTLAVAASEGKLADAAASCLPAEVQSIQLADQKLIGWPGEVFVEFAMCVMLKHPQAHIITLSNGDLQGYLVTQNAIDQKTYEAGNAIFASPASGQRLVEKTLQLLEETAHLTA